MGRRFSLLCAVCKLLIKNHLCMTIVGIRRAPNEATSTLGPTEAEECPKGFMRDKHKKQSQMPRSQFGFSMVELSVVVLIILIVVAVALINMVPTVQNAKANSGMELVMGELRRAHERAVDERRIYRVTFVAPQTIQLDVGQVANRRDHDHRNRTIILHRRRHPSRCPTGIQFIVRCRDSDERRSDSGRIRLGCERDRFRHREWRWRDTDLFSTRRAGAGRREPAERRRRFTSRSRAISLRVER